MSLKNLISQPEGYKNELFLGGGGSWGPLPFPIFDVTVQKMGHLRRQIKVKVLWVGPDLVR